jgi:tetratricopeptide (TPR) repeat protein
MSNEHLSGFLQSVANLRHARTGSSSNTKHYDLFSAAPIHLIVMFLTLGFSFAVRAQPAADGDSSTELIQRVLKLYDEGKFAEAIPLAEKLVALAKRTKGNGDPDTAASLNTLGQLYRAIGDYAKAEPPLKEALEIRQKVLGQDNADIATSLNNLAMLYRAMGDYAKAEPLCKQALQIDQKVLGREHPDTATCLNNLAVLYLAMGDYAKAEPLYQEVLEIIQKVLGREHPLTASSLNNLATLYKYQGNYAKAEPLYKEALEIRQKVLGCEHPDTAQSLNNLALLYKDQGDYAKAEPLLKEALEINQKVFGREHPDTAQTMNSLAEFYHDMGDYAKAEPLLKEALEINQKVLGREHPDTATSLDNLASLYRDLGDYAKAEPLLKEALEIRQKVLGQEHPLVATSLNSLALFYQDMGEYAKAEPLLKEALEIRQKVLGPEHADTATSLNNLALLYQDLGDYAKAEPLSKKALEINEKVLGPENPDTAKSQNYLALLYQDMGEYAEAEPLYSQALKTRRKVLGREHPYTAESLNNLALLYQDMGDYVKAKPLLKEAQEIDEKVLGPDNPDTAKSRDNLAYLEFDLGEIQEAKRLGQIGYAAGAKAFAQILSFGSEGQRLAYQRRLNPYALFAALGECDSFLASAVLHYKGVVLDSIIEDRLLAETGKKEANRDLVDQLKIKKRIVARLSLQATEASPKEAREDVHTLEQEVENIEGQLARQVTDIGQTRRAFTVTVEQVQGALPQDAVLVEYVRYFHYLGKSKYELRYAAVVLSADAPPRWVTLGGAKEIEPILKRCQRLVRKASDEELAAILHKVYTEVWEPVEQAFPAGATRVIVSPDGQLNFLAFATLLDPHEAFVAEKYSIQYATSGRDLLRVTQPNSSQQVIVMANPNFDSDFQPASLNLPLGGSSVLRGAEKRDFEDLSFQELPGSQKESAQLMPKFEHWGWPARSFTGPDVNKRALLDLRSPYILHLATHGFFEPEDSSFETNPNESQSPGFKSHLAKSRFFENPMHRSGLALAGANTTIAAWKRGEAPPIEADGMLTAEDVSALDLKGTWLVTLSACDTGSGEARAGEGVMGLRRGFVEAGAQNLLMTLWPISDEFTLQIMSDFYDTAHASGNAPEALAKVQRDWLVRLRNEQGVANAVNLAGPFIMSSQGKP